MEQTPSAPASASTTIGVVIRQQGWFRPHVNINTLDTFPLEAINQVPIHPVGMNRLRVFVGRGPVEQELQGDARLWFDHGEVEYPTFQCPSIGPAGAALMVSPMKARRVTATADEALSAIDVSLIQPVAPSFPEEYGREIGKNATGPAITAVLEWTRQAKRWLDLSIGAYALYQYPIVWELLARDTVVGFVNIEAGTFQLSTRIEADNFIPFLLNAAPKLHNGALVDHALDNIGVLGEDFHLPLVLLQRALWHRSVELRFLEAFLLLDYLTSLSDILDPNRDDRLELFRLIEQFIREQHPKHSDRIARLKHVILAAPLRERLTLYLQSVGIQFDPATIGTLLQLRNDLAHARTIDGDRLSHGELEVRRLAREALRVALATRGLTFGAAPTGQQTASDVSTPGSL